MKGILYIKVSFNYMRISCIFAPYRDGISKMINYISGNSVSNMSK